MVSFEMDSFIEDKDSTVWIATLSDGRVVYEDDGRPEYTECSAWKRLKSFCFQNGIYVKSMVIKFRSHTEVCPPSEEGYFFRKGVLGVYGLDKTIHFYLTGPIIAGKIHVRKWQVPEIVLESQETRETEGNEDGIIWNPYPD